MLLVILNWGEKPRKSLSLTMILPDITRACLSVPFLVEILSGLLNSLKARHSG
jgi:hypothetical protein